MGGGAEEGYLPGNVVSVGDKETRKGKGQFPGGDTEAITLGLGVCCSPA